MDAQEQVSIGSGDSATTGNLALHERLQAALDGLSGDLGPVTAEVFDRLHTGSPGNVTKSTISLELLLVRALLALGRYSEIDEVSLRAVRLACDLRDADLICDCLQERAIAMALLQELPASVEAEAALLQARILQSAKARPGYDYSTQFEFLIGRLHAANELKASHPQDSDAFTRLKIASVISSGVERICRGGQREGLRLLAQALQDQRNAESPTYMPFALLMNIDALITCGDSDQAKDLVREYIKQYERYTAQSGAGARLERSMEATHVGTGGFSATKREELQRRFAFFQSHAALAELPQDPTGRHTYRVGRLAYLLAERRGLDPELCFFIEMAARLHDVGILYLESVYVRNTKQLSAADRKIFESHCMNGHSLLSQSEIPKREMCAQVALHHHERWDGTGYPTGKNAWAIPEPARIVSICDSFDVITHGRPYKAAVSVAEALEAIRMGSGTQFDPALAHLFIQMIPELRLTDANLESLLSEGQGSLGFPQKQQRISSLLIPERQANVPDKLTN
jgi:HD-GYP domain-containing protein (c-di-GMP phosphodiesterase class II)